MSASAHAEQQARAPVQLRVIAEKASRLLSALLADVCFCCARSHGLHWDVKWSKRRWRLGGTLSGGVEYFTSRTFSVRGEARYHAVMKADRYDPSGLALSVGVKTYF
jgi:hypothetical protein